MSFFGDTPEEISDEKDGGSNTAGALVLAVLFLPSVFSALAFYLMLRKGRQRLSVIFTTLLAYEFVLFLLWKLTDAQTRFVAAMKDWDRLKETWPDLIPAFAIFYLALGGLIGLTLAWFETRQMKANPHRLVVKGNWMHGFAYRRTPLQVMRRRKRIAGLKAGSFVDEEKSPLGLNEQDEDTVVYRYNSEAIKHTLLVGASGSGKTFTMQSLIRGDILNNLPTIIIDFKRSPEFASRVAAWTKEANGSFYHFVNGELEDYDIKHSEGQSFYDPLAAGSPTSKADMVLGMREYDTASAVYKANMQQLLQVLFSMLHYADRSKAPSVKWDNGGIYQLASAVAGDNFTELAVACEGTPIGKDAEELANQAKGRGGINHAMEELRGQLRTIIASEYGRWMKTSPSTRGIDLFQMTQAPGAVILFSLNSDSEPEFARYVGSMIMADLTNTSARRRNEQIQNQINVYIDEFQAVNPSTVTGLLEKSRESRMAMTLAQQSFEQIVAAAPSNGEAYLLSVLDTCSNFIVHNGSTEDSAERLSKILGKHWVTSYRASNKNQSFFMSINFANRRESVVQTFEEEKWVFSPREFMTLSSPSKNNGFRATAVVVNKSTSDPRYNDVEGALARKVWLIPDDALTEAYYEKGYRLQAPKPVTPPPELAAPLPSEAPVAQEYDYLAVKAEAQRKIDDAFSELDDDEDDDSFQWEEVTEEEETSPEEEELRAIVDETEPWEDHEVPPAPLPQAPRRRQSTFGAVAQDGLPALPPLTPTPKQSSPPPPAREERGLPVPSGLPVPGRLPRSTPVEPSREEEEEEFKLPPL